MNQSRLHKIFGVIVFLLAFYTYFSTVQPSVSFWDCGEFIASSYGLQVPHPPGAPFFLIEGRVFSMIPFASNIGLRVNMISVITAALAILFLYLIAIKLIDNFTDKSKRSMLEAIGIFTSAAIGALSLAFSDTYWFNAVEAEVYAFSMFFITFVIWLLLIWYEKSDEHDSEKYLIFIAYLIGLASGVHLMAVLATVPIVMVVMFKKYVTDDEILKKTAYLFVGQAVLLLLIAIAMWAALTETSPPTQAQYQAVDNRFIMVFAAVSLLYMGIFWKKIFNKNSFYLSMIVGAIALVIIYPGMVKDVVKLINYVGGGDILYSSLAFIGIFVILGYFIYWSRKEKRGTVNLIFKVLFFLLIGYSSYTMVIIRANQNPPINENDPKTYPRLESYLSRSQYGNFPNFQRRYSQEPNQQAIYKNYSSDLDFLIRYQMNEMFQRYLFWNYIGRVSTVQGAGVKWAQLFGIPFFLGLLGLYYHFKKDWKMASVFLVMFIFLGYLTAFYQNQQQPQPRERDYFYVGAFFVYSLWIALGMYGIIDLIKEKFLKSKMLKPLVFGALFLGIAFVPYNMRRTNYFTHDRSRNYVPWDYSYNLLQSVRPNAILFTNGDNDTFPLWYLQNVEGVRRDVRIANLSLLNTPWYIKQLKYLTPYGALRVPISYSRSEIDRIGPIQWKGKKIVVPVPRDVYKKFGITDTSVINKGKIQWIMKNTTQFGRIKAVRTQDLMVLDIIETNKWKRPIYFAVTVGDQGKIGLSNYLDMEGLAFRLVPKKEKSYYAAVNTQIMRKDLFDQPKGFSKSYQPGFKFRGLNDPTVFLNANHRRLTINYRNAYIRLALNYLYVKRDSAMTIATLNEMNKIMPLKLIPVDYRLLNDIAEIYWSAGDRKAYIKLAKQVEAKALHQININPANVYGNYNPYLLLKGIYDRLHEYNKFVNVLLKLQAVRPGDPSVTRLINQYRHLARADTSEVNKKMMKLKK